MDTPTTTPEPGGTNGTNHGPDTTPTQGGKTDGFQPITTQEGLNAIIADRLTRERNKYADYEQLKAQAAKYTEWEASQKTAAEKQSELIATLKAEKQALETTALRAEIAAAKNVPMALIAAGSTREEIEALADQLIAFRGEQTQTVKTPGARVDAPGEKTPISGPDQITSVEQIKNMSPEDTMKALQEGRLTQIMKGD